MSILKYYSNPWIKSSFLPDKAGFDSDSDLHLWLLTLAVDGVDQTGQFLRKQGRELVRDILAKYVDKLPEALHIGRGPHGKPHLKHNECHFSLSHSGPYLLLAVTPAGSVGVDIEVVRPRVSILKLLWRYGGQDAVAWYLAQDEAERLILFYRFWTRLEAFTKACGDSVLSTLRLRWIWALMKNLDHHVHCNGDVWIDDLSGIVGAQAAIAWQFEENNVVKKYRITLKISGK